MTQIIEDNGDWIVYRDGEVIGIFDLDFVEKFYGDIPVGEEGDLE